MRILIAEDDLISRNFLSKFLSKYGECDLVVDGLETLDAFLMALNDKEPYQLICLDIMMPKLDGVKTLKAIRDLEKQSGIPPDNRVKIIMTTALAEVQLVKTAFIYGCEAFAAKPIDTQKLIEVMEKLGLFSLEKNIQFSAHKLKEFDKYHEIERDTTEPIAEPAAAVSLPHTDTQPTEGYFKRVHALPDYQLEVTMETGNTIHFDFRSRLNTARFGKLREEKLFNSIYTDGSYLIFQTEGKMPVKITALEFMDLVLIDRRMLQECAH